MSFNWMEYYNLAKELSRDKTFTSTEEARFRSAISRAYYSVIIQARTQICIILSIQSPYGNTHAWTIGKYSSHPDGRAKRISAWLKRLKKRREKADYENYLPNIESELLSALTEAEKILNELNMLK